MTVFRYRWRDPDPTHISDLLRPAIAATMVVSEPAPRPVVDVTLIGETPEDKMDLDAAMTNEGWEYESTNPPNTPQGIILRQEVGAELATDESINVNMWTDLITVPITTEAGVLTFIGAMTAQAAGGLGYFRVTVDGIPLRNSAVEGLSNVFLARRVPITPGPHTVRLQWRVDLPATMNVRPVTLPEAEFASLLVREMSG